VAEACLLFGWAPDQTLEMPAIRFFALMKAGRKLKEQKEAAHYVSLCDIASIGLGDAKYYEEVRTLFVNRAIGYETKKRKALDPTDASTLELVRNLFDEAQRLH